MNRYYVEVEHPVSNNIVYLYMFAYDSKQIIDMIDLVIVSIEKIYE
jgi:hypothetical protein